MSLKAGNTPIPAAEPAAGEAAAPVAKRGRKPAEPYVPVSFQDALYLVVTQTKTGLVAKSAATPAEAEELGAKLAQKGQDVLLFGPQAMLLRKAANPVEKLAFTLAE